MSQSMLTMKNIIERYSGNDNIKYKSEKFENIASDSE